MKKMALVLFGLIMMFGVAAAESATATFTTDEGQKLQIIINRKVVNSEPKQVVKIKGSGGIHQVKIKVYNGQELYVTKEQLRITPGYRNDYTVSINSKSRLEVKKTGSKMIYNYRHRRPDRFYNKRFYACLKKQNLNKPAVAKATHNKQLPTISIAQTFVRRKQVPFRTKHVLWIRPTSVINHQRIFSA